MKTNRILLSALLFLGTARSAEPVWPATFASPYVDATAWPTYDLAGSARASGLRHFVLAFVVARDAKTPKPTWGTYYPADDGVFLKGAVDSLRALGGDVMVSFGGASNVELAASTTSVDTLEAAYDRVVRAYDLHRIDFDIEGAWVADKASIERRSQALSALQGKWSREGRKMSIWYTLPVLPTGLDPNGEAVLESALAHGVALSGVNVMAMDYGSWAAPHPADSMGQYAIQAAKSLHSQLVSAHARHGIVRTEAELWAMVGVTPMIGQNDAQDEVFTLAHARELETFAASRGLGMVGWWSANRDLACPAGQSSWGASGSCSSVAQDSFAYAKTFLPLEAVGPAGVRRVANRTASIGIPALEWRVRGRDPSGRVR